VENLYFHNSQLRGIKSFLPTNTPALVKMTQQQLQPAAEPSPSAPGFQPPPPLSSILGASNLVSSFDPVTASSVPEISAPHQDSIVHPATTVSTPLVPFIFPNTLTSPNPPIDDLSMQTDPHVETSTPFSISIEPFPQLLSTQDTTPTASSSNALPTTITLSIPPITQPENTNPPTSTSNQYYPPFTKTLRTRNNKHPGGPKGAHQNLTTKDMLDFASTSAMTYDSFWSSHSHSHSGLMPSSTPPTVRPSSSSSSGGGIVVTTPGTGIAGFGSALQHSSLYNTTESLPLDFSQFANLSPFAAPPPLPSATVPSNIEQFHQSIMQ
jgi:hypothetical protein